MQTTSSAIRMHTPLPCRRGPRPVTQSRARAARVTHVLFALGALPLIACRDEPAPRRTFVRIESLVGRWVLRDTIPIATDHRVLRNVTLDVTTSSQGSVIRGGATALGEGGLVVNGGLSPIIADTTFCRRVVRPPTVQRLCFYIDSEDRTPGTNRYFAVGFDVVPVGAADADTAVRLEGRRLASWQV